MKTTGPIQALMPGFLGLMNLKTMGVQPNRLQDEIQAGMDAEPWFLRGALENWTTASSRTMAPGSYNSIAQYTAGDITVPDGEWWWVERYSVSVVAGALGAVVFAAPAFQIFGGASAPQFLLGSSVGVDITTSNPSALMGGENFWVPPGSNLGFWLGQVVGGNVTFAVAGLRFSRLPV